MTYKEMFQDELALKMAAVTKLTRNLFLAGVIPAMAYLHARQASTAAVAASASESLAKSSPGLIKQVKLGRSHQGLARTRVKGV